ncbi:MAG TPA: VanW family protein [Patescibacteria group bacterium]
MISYGQVVSNKLKELFNIPNIVKVLKNSKIQILLIGIILGLLIIGFLPYLIEQKFKNNVIGKVTIGSINLSGRNFEQARELIETQVNYLNSQLIVISYQEKKWQFTPNELGFEVDSLATFTRVKNLGRNGNVLEKLVDQISLLFKPREVKFVLISNQDQFQNGLSKATNEIETPYQNAKFKVENKLNPKLSVISENQGTKVDKTTLILAIENNLSSNKQGDLFLVVTNDPPQISKQEAEIFIPEVNKLVSAKLLLSFKNQTFQIDSFDLVNSLTLTQTLNNQAQLLNLSTASATADKLNYFKLTLDPDSFEKILEPITKQIESEATNAKFTIENSRVTVFDPSKDGVKINKQALFISIGDWLNYQATDKTIEIAAEITPAEITTASVNNLGIKELIGKGSSNFSGSSNERIHNIRTATNKINGTLIKPNEEFSFNKTVGEITLATGYTTAYIISKGRTVLGEGGGVCQVSTTVFRAALNSGLPFSERNAHAYRVSYYEKDSAPGFDATIYHPSVDLIFKNDTPGYILIKSYIAGNILIFEFYGTSDDRKVEIDKPIITNVVAAPEPAYEDDPQLPAGQLKQVDFAAPGANVKITRRVIKAGQETITSTFTSVYKPWQAVYKRGTKV